MRIYKLKEELDNLINVLHHNMEKYPDEPLYEKQPERAEELLAQAIDQIKKIEDYLAKPWKQTY